MPSIDSELIVFIIQAVATIVAGILGWFKFIGRSIFDRRKVYNWLVSNTKDEPEQSHVDTATVAKGIKMSEDRVRMACMSHTKIYRYCNDKELWSVWREQPQEPESAYNNLTRDEMSERMRL